MEGESQVDSHSSTVEKIEDSAEIEPKIKEANSESVKAGSNSEEQVSMSVPEITEVNSAEDSESFQKLKHAVENLTLSRENELKNLEMQKELTAEIRKERDRCLEDSSRKSLELKDLESKTNQLKETVILLQREGDQLKGELSETKRELTTLKSQISSLETEKESLGTRLIEKTEECNTLNTELGLLKVNHGYASTEGEKLREQLADKENKIALLTEENQNYQRRYEEQRGEMDRVVAKAHRDLERESERRQIAEQGKQKLVSELRTLEDTHTLQKQENEQLASKMSELLTESRDHHAIQDRAISLARELEMMTALQSKAEQKESQAVLEKQQLQAQLADADKVINKYELKIEELENYRVKYEAGKAVLAKEIEEREKLNANYGSLKESLHKTLDSLDQQLEVVKKRDDLIRALQENVEVLEAKNRKAHAESRDLSIDNANKTAEVEALKSRLLRQDTAIEDLKAELQHGVYAKQELIDNKRLSEGTVQELGVKIEAYVQREKDLIQAVKEQREALAAREAEIKELHKAVRLREGKIAKLKEKRDTRTASLEHTVGQWRMKTVSLEQANAALLRQIDELEGQKKKLEKEVFTQRKKRKLLTQRVRESTMAVGLEQERVDALQSHHEAELEAERLYIEDLGASKQAADDMIVMLQAEIAELKSKHSRLRATHQQAVQEKKRNEEEKDSRIATLESSLREAKQRALDLTQGRTKLLLTLDKQKEELRQLRSGDLSSTQQFNRTLPVRSPARPSTRPSSARLSSTMPPAHQLSVGDLD